MAQPLSLSQWVFQLSALTSFSVVLPASAQSIPSGGLVLGPYLQSAGTHYFLLFFTDNRVLCATVTQGSPDQTVTSGSKVTLLCTYKTSDSDPDLYWYRIRPDHSFQFILYRDNTESEDAEFTQGWFSVQHSQTRKNFHLVISSVEIEDSATYYCALRSTVM